MFEPYMKEQIQKFEEMCLNGHVALNTLLYDGWLLKFSEGYTGRANSVSVLYPSSKPLEKKVSYCEEVYKKQQLPCQFKLTELDSELNDYLAKRGYQPITPTHLMVCDLEYWSTPSNADSSIKYIFSSKPDEWLPVYFKIHEINDLRDQDIFHRMLAKPSGLRIEYTAFSSIKILLATPIARAPPELPSPVTTAIIGT